MSDIAALRRQRGSIKSSCTRIKSYVDSIAEIDADVIAQVEERRAKLDEYWAQYNDIQAQLEAIDEANEGNDRALFEEAFYAVCARMRRVMQHPSAIQQPTLRSLSTDNRSEISGSHVRLPKLNLPSFSGRYDEWFPFYDLFNSVIHNNASLTDTQKFQYLKTSLSGDAASVIHSLELSDQNYSVAWDILRSRYDNKRVIVATHVRAIFDLPTMARENARELRQIADGTAKHILSLKSLGRPVDNWDDLLIHVLISKLDPVTSREWQTTIAGSELPTRKQFLDFLLRRCQMLEASARPPLPISPSTAPPRVATRSVTNIKRNAAAHVAVAKDGCVFCGGQHIVYTCGQFSKLSPQQRLAEMQKRGLCTNCLRSTHHNASRCNGSSCKTCNAKHHSLLHIFSKGNVLVNDSAPSSSRVVASEPSPPSDAGQSIVAAHASLPTGSGYAMLATAIVNVDDGSGVLHRCRALLDGGSQLNFVSRRFLDGIKLRPRPTDVSFTGANGIVSSTHHAVELRVRSRFNAFTADIDCVVADRVTEDIPAATLQRGQIEIPHHLRLADPQFHVSAGIDLLIGSDIFWQLLCVGQIKPSARHPTLQKTQLGWIVAGRHGFPLPGIRLTKPQSFHAVITNRELHNGLQRFWDFEDVRPPVESRSLHDETCEKHFLDNVSRGPGGRFVVRLPCKEDVLCAIGDSRTIAERRFRALEARLDREPELKDRYTAFIREYFALGHMRLVGEESDARVQPVVYLPHHCVFKSSSETTKLRVVFDASCKSSTGVSLNDALLVGPVVQQDLISIIMRFRTFAYVFAADIVKMYRQILVQPDQTRLQRILWRDDKTRNLDTYELTTITYGTSSASFLATRCLKYLADQEKLNFPVGALHVSRDFYVDDILTGADSLQQAKLVREQVISVLERGSFTLSKWLSNSPELLDRLQDSATQTVDFNKDLESRILGIRWNPTSDCFHFIIKTESPTNSITKRAILSEIHEIFDPLGFVGPSVIISKLIIQELWQLNTRWDESVPLHLHTRWSRFRKQLDSFNELRIPRRVKFSSEPRRVQLHGFCDASQGAYGACVYVRSRVSRDEYRVELLCSKSRVAPLKALSLPRLELCAAVLLAQLMHRIRGSINASGVREFFWSDSTIALSWIASCSRGWTVFVANRVGEIQRLTDIADWRHVPSKENPADLLSRGVEPAELSGCLLWWNGPSYLKHGESFWPSIGDVLPLADMPEVRGGTVAVTTVDESPINQLINKCSSFDKICRIIAYCLRFINRRRELSSSCPRFVSSREIYAARLALCRFVQSSAFRRELHLLSNGKAIDASSGILSLTPFLGSDGLLRVGGRLRNADIAYDIKHPILLPKGHRVTKLIIESEHVRNKHAGVQATIVAVRQNFWPISVRCTARAIIRSCIVCFKARPIISEAMMGALPVKRVTASRPFLHCGVDYAGPVLIRDGKRRNSKIVKGYVAVFVCFATRAVHIEIVSDLTTESFLGALKRFVSRRGQPQSIHSDNGTTFTGASRKLREFYEFISRVPVQTEIEEAIRGSEIHWSFIPPNAPHFGGLWEAAVKSAKLHLVRIVGEAHLTFEELQTVLCEIEAVLNSRTITPLSEDPNDLSCLTPGHFLVGEPLNSFPQPELTDVSVNRLIRWQRVEQIRQQFWKRWSMEYLGQLQERHKWGKSKGEQLKVGQLVLVKQQQLAPLQWLRGRIEEIHLGADGIARSAKVKTMKASIIRPLSKLAVLPIEA